MADRLDDIALDAIFRAARTAQYYRADSRVTEADVRAIHDLLKMAPTSANSQPGRFVWLLSDAGRARLAECASGANPDKIRRAPAAVIIAYDVDFHEQLPWLFPHDQTAKDWIPTEAGRATAALRNSSLQGAYLIVAARALGFDVGPMSGFDNAAVDAAFFADRPKVRSNFIATLGHADPEKLFPRGPRPTFEQFNTIA